IHSAGAGVIPTLGEVTRVKSAIAFGLMGNGLMYVAGSAALSPPHPKARLFPSKTTRPTPGALAKGAMNPLTMLARLVVAQIGIQSAPAATTMEAATGPLPTATPLIIGPAGSRA